MFKICCRCGCGQLPPSHGRARQHRAGDRLLGTGCRLKQTGVPTALANNCLFLTAARTFCAISSVSWKWLGFLFFFFFYSTLQRWFRTRWLFHCLCQRKRCGKAAGRRWLVFPGSAPFSLLLCGQLSGAARWGWPWSPYGHACTVTCSPWSSSPSRAYQLRLSLHCRSSRQPGAKSERAKVPLGMAGGSRRGDWSGVCKVWSPRWRAWGSLSSSHIGITPSSSLVWDRSHVFLIPCHPRVGQPSERSPASPKPASGIKMKCNLGLLPTPLIVSVQLTFNLLKHSLGYFFGCGSVDWNT